MTARALPFLGRRTIRGTSDRTAWLALIAGAVALWIVFRGQWILPHEPDTGVFRALNTLRDEVIALQRSQPLVAAPFDAVRAGFDILFNGILGTLTGLGWPAVIAVAAALGYAAGGWRTAVLAFAGLLALGLLNLWEPSMETLSITLAAVIASVAVGVPLGILAAKRRRFGNAITPVLDVLQIMPQFAYLLPFVVFFGIGAPAAAIVTFVYALPAAIRITALGIRGVPVPSLEAARSLGATGAQVLTKVELPLARHTIGLAVNQTIMLALSMVVITALIDGPGLGVNIDRARQTLNMGLLFNAGIAVVILAIVLDRVTEQASRRMDARERSLAVERGDRPLIPRRVGLGLMGALVAGALSLNVLTPDLTFEFPEDWAILSFREPVNEIVRWINTNLFVLTDTFKEGVTAVVIQPLQTVLTSAPFWLVMAVAGAIGWLVSGPRAGLLAVVTLGGIVALQLWTNSMITLASVLVATAITLVIGGVIGIVAARSSRFSRAIRPFLDAAQTLPAYLYLLPALALFGPSRFTAIVAAVIFAVPPVVRLVEAGIRLVPPTIVEAGTAAGATSSQLLWKIQLPVARPALLLATNQGIVMVLGMVVLGGLVGGGALGFDVVNGFGQRAEFGQGLAAGICIILLGIALDRISQGAGRRRTIDAAPSATPRATPEPAPEAA